MGDCLGMAEGMAEGTLDDAVGGALSGTVDDTVEGGPVDDSVEGMDATGSTTAPALVPHARIVREWRAGQATTVTPDAIGFVHWAGEWWSRTGPFWAPVADSTLAAALADEHASYAGDVPPHCLRDPWTIARNRLRTAVRCGRPPVFMPMFAAEPRPFPAVVCRR
jgi:hypothetical protein